MKKSITQIHALGCGIACIAFILNKSYKVLINSSTGIRAEKRGFYAKELVALLKKYDQNYKFKYIKNRFKNIYYKDKVIVYLKKSRSYPKGHYLVRFKKLWMDPWINFIISKDIKKAKSGFRKKLPGKPIYAIIPE